MSNKKVDFWKATIPGMFWLLQLQKHIELGNVEWCPLLIGFLVATH